MSNLYESTVSSNAGPRLQDLSQFTYSLPYCTSSSHPQLGGPIYALYLDSENLVLQFFIGGLIVLL